MQEVQTLEEKTESYSWIDAQLDSNRFFNADDEPIILAETSGHARIELT